MMLHRHFENNTSKTVTKLADVTPKAKASKAKPETKATEQTAKKTGKAKSK